jgi:CO/xanthine dehydrogenase Mo-binding subunit
VAEKLLLARRDLLKGAAALVISVSVRPALALTVGAGDAGIARRDLDPAKLDTWLAVAANGDVTGYWGKMDMGQGVDTAIAQMIAEELDISVDRVSIVAGDSALCADQGGASGSTGLSRSGVAFQAAAAEARLVLCERAAARFKTPLANLVVTDGVIRLRDDPARAVSYAELIGAQKFAATLAWNGEHGNNLALASRAVAKKPQDYRVVGTSVPRKDIAGKVLATTEFLHDVRLPGMLHGRMVRPAVAGARVISVDKESVRNLPGVQVVVENDFVGVVAPNEWDAVNAARQLKVEWNYDDVGFPTDSVGLFEWIRAAVPAKAGVDKDDGDVTAALAAAASALTAEYEWPFQSHARMAGAASVADVRAGDVLIYTDSQKPFDAGIGAKQLLEAPVPQRPQGRAPFDVRSIWKPGPGSYGRSDAGDGAMDAVVLSQAVGAPVRVQWMRHEGHAWDPKGPASVVSCKAGIDLGGNVSAYHFHIRGFSRHDQNSRENAPGEVLAGHLLGHASTPEWRLNTPAESYRFANKRYSWEALRPLRQQASPLRTSHFRDPYGPEVHFASESFIDELAYATGRDPLAFRLGLVSDERDAAVLQAAAKLAGWQPRSAPRKQRDGNGNYVGQGIAYAQRSGAVNAVVAEIEVNPQTGRIWVRRMYVGADAGLIVNPFTLDRVIEGNLVQATSRTLFEEVIFDREMVRSDDWLSYPILDIMDAPLEIKITQINRPELGPQGAGEPTTRVTPAAIGNAFFDATGVRLRRVPFTPERVLLALKGA